jgi:BolA family transcriptional regulator, general stress-responsive regulator
MAAVADVIRDKLTTAFAPERLEVKDESWRHAGHADAREGGESHFDVVITAAVFQGLSRVERQRRINAALREEFAGPIHALSLKALAPGEG